MYIAVFQLLGSIVGTSKIPIPKKLLVTTWYTTLKNIQILSCFMFISISRPNQGRLTDNNSDSGPATLTVPT